MMYATPQTLQYEVKSDQNCTLCHLTGVGTFYLMSIERPGGVLISGKC